MAFADHQVHALQAPQAQLPFVHTKDDDPRRGLLTIVALTMLRRMFEFVSGTARIFPVGIVGTNSLTLTTAPTGPAVFMMPGDPVGAGYHNYDVFSGVAENTSTGAVTATAVLAARPGSPEVTLGTLKVYTTNGAAQAGAGDLVVGRHYTFTFVDTLDAGNGGLVLR